MSDEMLKYMIIGVFILFAIVIIAYFILKKMIGKSE